MKSEGYGAWTLIRLVVILGLLIGVGTANAQSHFYMRVAPEMGRTTVEHTKKVTIQGGSSSSTSASSGLSLLGTVAAGLSSSLPRNWLLRGEVEGVVSGQRKLEGTISPTTSGNVHDVWPGRWDYKDLAGVGGNILFGRRVAGGVAEVYLLGGVRRSWTEFATGGIDPETGVAGEDRERLGRWSWAIGAGTTLRLKWPLDFRVRYLPSVTDWIIDAPDLRLDYRYKTSGVLVSVGIHLFG
ncbi:MAG: hypothetical protein OXN89_18505 [Bryobacterales bacterium]|nr:hypothetical protein [Bryobacterales bacterium]